MNILVISNLYPPHYVGGYELRCQIAVEAMRQRGHTVQVLTSNHGVEAATAAMPEHGIERTLRIHGFFGHPWLGIRRLIGLELHNNQTVRAAIASCKPDVIHVWNLGGLSKSITWTLQESGIPAVYDISDHWIARSLQADVWLDWWNRAKPAWPARLLRSVWTLLGYRNRWGKVAPTKPIPEIQFPRIYFCSRALRELTEAKGYPVHHGEVIYCSVNTTRYHGIVSAPDKPMRKLLYVGRLAEDKGVMTALKAMAILKGTFAGELHLYGKGDSGYVQELRAFVEANQLPVFFHSANAEAMPSVYRAHDALLFTSEWEEPFALTPLEAMASGLPVIGTMTGGSKELFRNGENALTYTAGSPRELADQILALAASGTLRARIASEGQTEVRLKYAESVIMDQMESYLKASALRPE